MASAPSPSGTLRPTRLGVAFLGLTLVTLVGCINYALGLGYAVTFLLGLVIWLVRHDVARRTINSTGAPRFMAASAGGRATKARRWPPSEAISSRSPGQRSSRRGQ